MKSQSGSGGILTRGMHAPPFELKDLDGNTQSLAEILGRGPVLLALFKVSCPVCQLTFPFLERVSKNDALQVIGISQDDAKATKAFNERFSVTFPTLLDESKEGFPVSNAFGISTVPSVFIVETDGTVSQSFAGFSKRDLEEIGKRVNVHPFRQDEYVPEFKAG
jgi:peroxiredoxin